MDEEKDFRDKYENRVLPYYRSGRFGEFPGVGGLKIRFVAFEKKDSTAALVFLPGKSETYLKYAEFFYDLKELPLSLYAMDHRGMGFSERMLADRLKMHVDRFDHYLQDVETFVETIVGIRRHHHLFVLGHSTGALVASLFLELHPEIFQAGILCAPFFDLSVGPVPGFLLRLVIRLLDRRGRSAEYGPGQKDIERSPFQSNTISHSYPRWSLWEQEIIPNNEAIRFGGVTNHWLRESLIAGRRAVQGAARIGVPLLLLQAEEDSITKYAAQDRFCRRASQCCKVLIRGARHEILIEQEDIRSEAMTRIKTFVQRQLQGT